LRSALSRKKVILKTAWTRAWTCSSGMCTVSGPEDYTNADSKPIRRPALKQVLNKFATIPEEPENVPDL
jgi:hypothetical protein